MLQTTMCTNPVEVSDLDAEWVLELAAEAEPYAVEVRFFEPSNDGQFELIISGNSGDKLEPWRRTFDFRELLARSGDAVCPPVPKLS